MTLLIILTLIILITYYLHAGLALTASSPTLLRDNSLTILIRALQIKFTALSLIIEGRGTS